jgi:hypothetical protein
MADTKMIDTIPEKYHEALYSELKEKFEKKDEKKPTEKELDEIVKTVMR